MTSHAIGHDRRTTIDKLLRLDPIDDYPEPGPGNPEAEATTYETLLMWALTTMLAVVMFGGLAWVIVTG